MLYPCEAVVVDIPQVFVGAHRPLRTAMEDVVHCLSWLSAGTFRVICKSPPVHVSICSSHLRSRSVECDPFLPAQRCSFRQVFLMRWQGIIRWAEVILDPVFNSGGRRPVRMEWFNRSKAAPGSEAGFHLLVIVEWVTRLIQLFKSLNSCCGISACAGGCYARESVQRWEWSSP